MGTGILCLQGAFISHQPHDQTGMGAVLQLHKEIGRKEQEASCRAKSFYQPDMTVQSICSRQA